MAQASRNQVTGELLHHVQSRRAGYNTVEHEYRRQPFLVPRPADGQPPEKGETRCEACGRTAGVHAAHRDLPSVDVLH